MSTPRVTEPPTEIPEREEDFFVIAGTLRPDAKSYITRSADQELYEALSRGVYCYVLDSRQMGKSSLMARTAKRLRDDGTRVAVVDLTKCGENVTPVEWYLNQLEQIGRYLKLSDALEDYWDSHDTGPLTRFLNAVRDVVIAASDSPVVIFIDEIDYVRVLPFPTDELFAGVRQCFTGRSTDNQLRKLSFCLLGVATPPDLIENPETTPFNIGKRIDLTDFRSEQVLQVFTQGFPDPDPPAESLLDRVMYWTNGQPFLTQALCFAVSKRSKPSPEDVDALCRDMYLLPGSEETNVHLQFVKKRVLQNKRHTAALSLYGNVLSHERFRRFGFLYKLLFSHKEILATGDNEITDVLRLAGLVRVENGILRARNRVYSTVFDRNWVSEKMPQDLARLQRQAYLRGIRNAVVPIAAVAAVIFAIFFGMFKDVQNRRLTNQRNETLKAEHKVEQQNQELEQQKEKLEGQAVAIKSESEENRKLSLKYNVLFEQERRAKNEATREALSAQAQAKLVTDANRKLAKSEESANQQRVRAENSAREADELRKTAQQDRDRYAQLEKEAFTHELALRSDWTRMQEPSALERSMLLAVQSLSRLPSPQADAALRSGLDLLPRREDSFEVSQHLNWFKLSDDAKLLAGLSLTPNGSVDVLSWQLDDRKHVPAIVSLPAIPDYTYTKVAHVQSPTRLALIATSNMRSSARSPKPANRADNLYVVDLPEASAKKLDLPRNASCLADEEFIGPDSLALLPCDSRAPVIIDLKSFRLRNVSFESPPQKEMSRWAPNVLERSTDGHSLLATFTGLRPPLSKKTLLVLWDTSTGKLRGTLQVPMLNPTITLSSDASYALLDEAKSTGDEDQSKSDSSACIWNTRDTKCDELKQFGTVGATAFYRNSAGNSYLLAIGTKTGVHVLDLRRGFAEVARLTNGSTVRAISFNLSGDRIATAGDDGTARVWDISEQNDSPRGREATRMPSDGLNVTQLSFSPDGRHISSIGKTKEEDRYQAITWDSYALSDSFRSKIGDSSNFIAFDKTHSAGFTATVNPPGDDYVSILSSGDLSEKNRFYETSVITATAASSDGKLLAIANASHVVDVWNVPKREKVREIPTSGPATNLVFSPSGAKLAAKGDDFLVITGTAENSSDIQRVRTDRSAQTKTPGEPGARRSPGGNRMAFTPGDDRLLIASPAGPSLQVWDLRQRKFIKSPYGNATQISDDGTHLLRSSTERNGYLTVESFDLSTDKKSAERDFPTNEHSIVAFDRRGTIVAVADQAGEVRVFDLTTGEKIRAQKFPAGVSKVAVDPTATAAASGQSVTVIRGPQGRPTKLEFLSAPDELRFAGTEPKLIVYVAPKYSQLGSTFIYTYTGSQFSPSRELPDSHSPHITPSAILVPKASATSVAGELNEILLRIRSMFGGIQWFDSTTGQSKRQIPVSQRILAVGYHAGSGLLATAMANPNKIVLHRIGFVNGAIQVSDLGSLPVNYISKLEFSPDGKRIAAAGGEELLILEAETLNVVQRHRYLERVISPTFASENVLYFGSGYRVYALQVDSNRLQSWDMPDTVQGLVSAQNSVAAYGKRYVLLKHGAGGFAPMNTKFSNALAGVVGNPNGTRWAVSSGTSVYVYDGQGKQISVLEHDASADPVGFAEDHGEFYLMTRSRRAVHIWQCDKGTETTDLITNADVNFATFTPNQTYAAIANGSTLQFTLWRQQDLIDAACERLHRKELSDDEWKQYFQNRERRSTCTSNTNLVDGLVK